jgi:5-methylcytosine-specific restriction enzyme A
MKIKDDKATESDAVIEGQVLYKFHKVIERNSKIVKAKKQQVLNKLGELKCEACGVNFEKKYGKI